MPPERVHFWSGTDFMFRQVTRAARDCDLTAVEWASLAVQEKLDRQAAHDRLRAALVAAEMDSDSRLTSAVQSLMGAGASQEEAIDAVRAALGHG